MSNGTANGVLDYGLEHIARHNAEVVPSVEDQTDSLFNDFEHDADGLGITSEDAFGHIDHIGGLFDRLESKAMTPTSPSSITPSPTRQTRSGRLIKSTMSPLSPTKNTTSRVSKSPRAKKPKASKSDKSKGPRIWEPLSELTKDSDVPVKDINAWVNRSSEDRIEESRQRKGHIARPMNSFMLYRSAFAERTKAWCKQNNHQVVSSVAGESWPMEPEEVREAFNDYAKIERENHAKAFPHYKFSPSKANVQKRVEDEEDDDSYSLADPDAEYVPARRSKQTRTSPQDAMYRGHSYPTSSPYMDAQYMYTNSALQQPRYVGEIQPRPLPMAYQSREVVFDSHQQATQPNVYAPNPYPAHIEALRIRADPTQASVYGAPPPPGGLPGTIQDGYQLSRDQTPGPYQHYPVQRRSFDHSNWQPNMYPSPAVPQSHFDPPFSFQENGMSMDSHQPNYWHNEARAMDPSLLEHPQSEALYVQHTQPHQYNW